VLNISTVLGYQMTSSSSTPIQAKTGNHTICLTSSASKTGLLLQELLMTWVGIISSSD